MSLGRNDEDGHLAGHLEYIHDRRVVRAPKAQEQTVGLSDLD